MTDHRPAPAVLRAFGVTGPPRLLAGGRGTSWAAGDLVLKPEDGAAHTWLAEVLPGITRTGFRLAEPVRTREGALTHDGWSATRWLAGSATRSAWADVLAAGRAFHRAVAHLPCPAFLNTRQDWWACADRVAWGERGIRFRPEFAGLAARLRDALEPLGPAQLVHGDLGGNVLFEPGLPPAVIDVSPYWRPPAYAEGIVVADAICWHDAPGSLWRDLSIPAAAVARALLFRMATTNEAADSGAPGRDLADEARRFHRTATALGR